MSEERPTTHGLSTTEIADLSAVLEGVGMGTDDRKYVLSSLWTQSEVPPVKSAKQYYAYANWQKNLDLKLAAAGFRLGDQVFSRSPDGMLATSIGARMIEWEEALE